jgi:hypothetical protein
MLLLAAAHPHRVDHAAHTTAATTCVPATPAHLRPPGHRCSTLRRPRTCWRATAHGLPLRMRFFVGDVGAVAALLSLSPAQAPAGHQSRCPGGNGCSCPDGGCANDSGHNFSGDADLGAKDANPGASEHVQENNAVSQITPTPIRLHDLLTSEGASDAHGCMDSRTTGVCQVTRLVASSITSMTKSTNERGQSFHMRFHRATSMTLSDVTARPLCAMGSPEPASMVRSVLSRYICEHVPSLYTSRAAAAREPIRT